MNRKRDRVCSQQDVGFIVGCFYVEDGAGLGN